MQPRDFLLERYYAEHEFATHYQLSASDCESLSIGEVLEESGTSTEDFLGLRLGYTESQGDPELREAIARFYPGCGPEDVVVTNAPEEAIFLAMHALLEEGDRVVVETPCYQSLLEVARSIGCEVVPWPLRETERGWKMDLDHLEDLLAGETQLLVVNAPHNPTGHHPTVGEWQRILALAEERDVGGLVSRLRWLVENVDQWSNICEFARHHVEKEFNAREQGERLAAIYREIVVN